MPHFYDTLPLGLQEWALQQSTFFTASAPTYGCHINLSPKGIPSTTLTIIDGNHAAYLDLTGSGAETISHIYENGRVTIMFCSFTNKPRIMRLFCTGRVVEVGSPAFQETARNIKLEVVPGTRAIIQLEIWKVQTSCGYGVPVSHQTDRGMEAQENLDVPSSQEGTTARPPCNCFQDRHTLEHWLANKIKKKTLGDYQAEWNSRSLDGLPGLQEARKTRGELIWLGDARHELVNTFYHPMALTLGLVLGFVLALVLTQNSNFSISIQRADLGLTHQSKRALFMVHQILLLAKHGAKTVRRCVT